MKLFLYVDRESVVHRLHPVTKILALPLLFAAALRLDELPVLGVAALVVLMLAAASRSLDAVAGMGSLLITLFVATTVVWGLFDPARGQVHGHADRAGLEHAAALGLRLSAMVSLGIVFLATTRVEDFAYGLRSLGLPYRVAFALTLAFRLVPTFVDSGRAVAEAQRARGLDLDHGGPVSRMRRYIPLLVPMFLTAVRRADRLAAALETRGFGSGEGRTDLIEHRFAARDVAALALVASLMVLSWHRGALVSAARLQAASDQAMVWIQTALARLRGER